MKDEPFSKDSQFQRPLISVVIPVYNEKQDIFKNTLESVVKQTYNNIEIAVVDDGSDVDIHSVIEQLNDHRISYYKLKHQNANVARNFGIEKSKGKYIAMLDSDDIWIETHIEDCIRLIENACADGLYGSLILKNPVKNTQQLVSVRELKASETMIDYLLSAGYGAQTSTLFLSSESAKNILWNPRLNRHQDYDFVVRYSKKYKFAVKTTPSVIYLISNKTSVIDFKSCIQFIKENKKDISPNLYNNYNRQMLYLAKSRNEPHEIIEYYRIEAVRYKEFVSYVQFMVIREPQSHIKKFKLKLEYLFYILYAYFTIL